MFLPRPDDFNKNNSLPLGGVATNGLKAPWSWREGMEEARPVSSLGQAGYIGICVTTNGLKAPWSWREGR